jgi:hypothetical protein
MSAPDMLHALAIRDELVKAIRTPRDPMTAGVNKVNTTHATAIAEYLIREGLVNLDELDRMALREPDDDASPPSE